MQQHLFQPILNIVYETMPRDNLLNSACLELFEFIKRENLKPVIVHIVENYRDKLKDITYVDTFQTLLLRYDQMQGYNADLESSMATQEEDEDTKTRINGNRRWQGVKEMDAAEEEYFNTSDDEDETLPAQKVNKQPRRLSNGETAVVKPLVDYPDEDEDAMDTKDDVPKADKATPVPLESAKAEEQVASPKTPDATPKTPPERLSEKRRREEDEDDELGKLSSQTKRRSSTSSVGSTHSTVLRRKQSFNHGKDSNSGKKIAISLALKSGGNTSAHNDG